MRDVFVDTVAWIALLNADDELHPSATALMDQLQTDGARLVTTEFVLLEVADALSAPGIRERTVRFVDGLRALPMLTILPADSQLLRAGWTLYSQRSDKDWGLTDCTSFAATSAHGVTHAFTADRHFEQAGFVRLLTT